MPTEKIYDLIDQAYNLGYRGLVKLHRLSDGPLDPRYLEFAIHIKNKGMKLFDDTNGDVLRNNPELCAKLDEVVSGFNIGLYDYTSEISKQNEIKFWKSRFKKATITFSMPLENCFLRKGSEHDYSQDYKNLLDQPCPQPYDFFQIRYDGEVSLCCEDDQCHFKLGNVFQQSLKDIWWSPKHIYLARALFKSGMRRHFKPCSVCVFMLVNINLLKEHS